MFHGLTDLLASPFQRGGPINKFVTPWVPKNHNWFDFDGANSFFFIIYIYLGSTFVTLGIQKDIIVLQIYCHDFFLNF
jgi:hypothetical protein